MMSGLRGWGQVSRLRLGTGDEVELFVGATGHHAKCLLLHGNPGSMSDWEPILPSLAEVADVAAVDLPGFGASPRTSERDEAFSLTRLARVGVAVADALGWTRPFFVLGHSHGGGVAQVLAALYPARVAGLGLLATLGSPVHPSYRLLALPGAKTSVALAAKLLQAPVPYVIRAGLMGAFMRDMFWPEPVPAARVARELERVAARPEIFTSMVQVALGSPCRQLLASAPTIRCPVLLVHGQRDRLVPPRFARNIHRAISESGGRSRLCELPGAGHMLIDFQTRELVEQLRPLLLAPLVH